MPLGKERQFLVGCFCVLEWLIAFIFFQIFVWFFEVRCFYIHLLTGPLNYLYMFIFKKYFAVVLFHPQSWSIGCLYTPSFLPHHPLAYHHLANNSFHPFFIRIPFLLPEFRLYGRQLPLGFQFIHTNLVPFSELTWMQIQWLYRKWDI